MYLKYGGLKFKKEMFCGIDLYGAGRSPADRYSAGDDESNP